MLKRLCFVTAVFMTSLNAASSDDPLAGTKRVDFFGYRDCVCLENENTRVVLCHQAGGRVLEYSLHGTNAIYLNPEAAGAMLGQKRADMTGGRFDIGPELVVPKRPTLWAGEWTATVPTDRTAVLTSPFDESAGVRLSREFVLHPSTSELRVTQTIHNEGDQPREYCHWSRTFAQGGGIVLIPLTEPSRMPKKYVMYGKNSSIMIRPEDSNIRVRDGFLEIVGAPQFPKLGMDSAAGWFTYLAPNNLLFTKRFSVDRDRVYNELAGLTISIWYPDGPMVELEPIGPREVLRPGESAAFTETWSLASFPFPAEQNVDLTTVADVALESFSN